jgi:hypothetical protein
MVDQSYIDNKVTQYVLDHGKKPRFVLLDKATFDRFTNYLKPKERIAIAVNDHAKIAKMCCSADCWVDILSVNTDNSLFEVTG